MSKSVDRVISDLEKKHGKNIVRKASQLPHLRVLPTGLAGLDARLGGGVLMGRTTILAGNENVGKSSLAMLIGAGAQRDFQTPLYYVDVEKAFDWKRAAIFGLQEDLTHVIQGELTAENVFKVVRDLIRAIKEQDDPRAVIVVDSLANMLIEKMFEDEATKQFGGSAKLINQSTQVWQILAEMNQVLILINQFREAIGSMGEDKDMPGGMAQKYVGATVLWMRAGQTLKDGTDPIGAEVRYTIKKSKTSSPKTTGVTNFYFKTGFDTVDDLGRTAVETGVFERSGAWVKYNGENYRKDDLVERLRNNSEFYREIRNSVLARITENGYPLWQGEIIKTNPDESQE